MVLKLKWIRIELHHKATVTLISDYFVKVEFYL